MIVDLYKLIHTYIYVYIDVSLSLSLVLMCTYIYIYSLARFSEALHGNVQINSFDLRIG